MLLIQNLQKKFNNKSVLENLNLEISENTIYAVIGRNGAGKSTLFHIIADLIPATSGEVLIYGKTHSSKDESVKKQMGLMLHERGLIDEFTGFDYLKFIGLIYEVNESNMDKKIEDTFSYFFDDKKDLFRNISHYSFGMKQKISFIASILYKPKLLVLDEPFIGLDAFSVKKVIGFLKSFSKNKIILLASHDFSYIEKIATHIGILDQGKLLYTGTVDNFTNNRIDFIEDSLLQMLKPKEGDLAKIDWLL